MKALLNWLDDRTGYREMLHESLYENIPGGSRWIYVTGSMLVCAFVTQAITGIFLWMYYSAGSQNAWESIYLLQTEVQGGWFLRGVHHVMAQMMVVLLPIHMLQVILCRAYTAPREINYWLGLVLMLLTLGLGLTGYLLPWDQKGYWATKVATELMSLPPGGGDIQKLAVGGEDYGHYTLTRFFAMHVGVLPALLIGTLALHIAMFRKHGVTAKSSDKRPDEYFWPMQVFKDAVACAIMMLVVVAVVCFEGGAELGPPAEPTEAYGAARPEWYYLFLFQLLKKFKSEFIGAIVVPGAVMAFLFAMPLISKIKFGHIVNCVVILTLVIGAGYLTYEAIMHDAYANGNTPVVVHEAADKEAALLHNERYFASKKYLEAQHLAEQEYERIKELIDEYGIPRIGAAQGLQKDDAFTQGPRLFLANCASCHSYLDEHGHGISGPQHPKYLFKTAEEVEGAGPDAAPNLYKFASREWIAGILDPERISSDEYFGRTAKKEGDMVGFVHDNMADLDEDGKKDRDAIVAALSAEAKLQYQTELDAEAEKSGLLAAGRTALVNNCSDCHTFGDEGYEGGPDLTGYGSAKWLRGMIADPDHSSFYGESGNDRMPGFAANPDDPEKNLLSDKQIDMLVRWLRQDFKTEAEQEQPAEPSSPNANEENNQNEAESAEVGSADGEAGTTGDGSTDATGDDNTVGSEDAATGDGSGESDADSTQTGNPAGTEGTADPEPVAPEPPVE